MICVLCGELVATTPVLSRFCEKCGKLLERHQITSEYQLQGYPLVCLYRYQGIIRRLIIQAKVKGVGIALDTITDMVFHAPQVREYLDWAEVIVPAPSSLWGRFHGRLDVAGVVAVRLGQWQKRPIYALRSWKMQKRAFIAADERIIEENYRCGIFEKNEINQDDKGVVQNIFSKRILMVDDIVTSGFTMASITRQFRRCEIKCLAFATANPKISG